jgi:hypothetical protein
MQVITSIASLWTSSLKIQRVAGIVHFGIFSCCLLIAISTSPDALSEAIWFILFWPDLPVSALFILTFVLLPSNVIFVVDRFIGNIFPTYPFNNFWHFWYLIIIYGILGTVWWFYLPKLVISVKKFFSQKKT